MKISCTGIGKRFSRDWIFRNVHYTFEPNTYYALTGANGSGKSTLLQVIAGAVLSSEGKMFYTHLGHNIDPQKVYQHLSVAAPYLEVIEEMTLKEFLEFHFIFKRLLPGLNVETIIEYISLQHAAHKQIRYFSSGMKQRVKLAQAFFSDTPCLLLDEPLTNLDAAGISLYYDLVEKFCVNRLVIVGSNDPQEYRFCTNIINISDFKKRNEVTP